MIMNRLILILPATFAIVAIIAYAAPSPRARLVLIDAGHGGHDTGGKFDKGIFEKDANLEMAKYIHEQVVPGHGMQVKLSRSDDSYMELSERGEMCTTGVDLAVSIHSSTPNEQSFSGFTVHCPGEGAFVEPSLLYATRLAAHLEENGIPVRISNRHNYYILVKTNCPSLMVSAEGTHPDSEMPLWMDGPVRALFAEALRRAVTGS